MNFDQEDEKLEAYLRQFQARAPRPLPTQRKHPFLRRPIGWAALAAAIVLAVALFALRDRHITQGRPSVQATVQRQQVADEISMIRLSRIAQQDPDTLGSRLDELSARLLPDVRASRGVLKQLARE
jgi:hypothetical protein